MTRVNRDTVFAILLLVGCGVLLNASFDIREPDYGQLSPAAWPRTVVGVLTFLSLIYLVQSIRRGVPEEPVEAEGTAKNGPRGLGEWIAYWRNVFWVFALFFAYLLALHAVIATVTVGGMWSLFTFGLGVLLPRGDLFGWF